MAGTSRELSAFLGTKAIQLLGRNNVLKKIEKQVTESVKQATPLLIYLQGRGGIGKTYLLRELRRKFSDQQYYLVAEGLIDLYHLDYQTPFGLAQAIADQFPQHFKNFKATVAKHQQNLRAHNPVEAEKLEQQAIDQWVADLKEQAGKRPVLIFLDTLERFAALEGLESSAENWLLKIFPQLQGKVKVVFFAAGRDQDVYGNRNTFLKKVDAINKQVYELSPLSPEHAREYLERVAELIQESDPPGAQRIRAFLAGTDAQGVYELTGGHPLYLALTADILRITGSMPFNAGQENFEAAVAEHLLKAEYPLSEALLWLSRLPKGANADLLAGLMQIDAKEAQKLLKYLGTLAIVKYRGAGYSRPYFLHDELYSIFRKHAPLPADDRARWYEAVMAYYDQELEKIDESHQQTYDFLIRQRQTLKVEKLHYQIWMEPVTGFGYYYALRGDALTSRFMHYVRAVVNEAWHTLPEIDLEEDVRQLFEDDRRAVALEEAILVKNDLEKGQQLLTNADFQTLFYQEIHRPLWQGILLIKKGDLKSAEEQLERLLNTMGRTGQLQSGAVYARALAHNYLGYITRQQDKPYQAVRHYNHAIAVFRRTKSDALSGTLINLAYAEKIVEHNRAAYGHIDEARWLAERSGNPYEMARVYNVESYLLLFDTKFEEALQAAGKALANIQQTSNPVMEGWIKLNLGRAWRYKWNPEAERGATARWQDYLPHAIAYVGTEGDWEKLERIVKREKLETILSRDELAIQRKKAGAAELLNPNQLGRLEAWCELGSVWREIAWALKKDPSLKDASHLQSADDTSESWYLKAAGLQRFPRESWEQHLQEQIAQLPSPFWPLWALTNLGWHWYYQKPDRAVRKQEDVNALQEKITWLADLVLAQIPADYRLDPPGQSRRREPAISKYEGILMLWKVLAKLEMLLARTALLQPKEATTSDYKDDQLGRAVDHWLRSLQYNKLLGGDSYDYKRGESNIHNRIRETPKWETEFLPRIYQKVVEIERLYGFDKENRSALFAFMRDRYGPPELWGVQE